ncbi:MAG: type II secretion system F family protein [Candidatus Omnitrophota bacterium]|nr:MAG: type II secretion system F family protein [Candidatus Omnitrophota bacterium]
MPTFKYVAKTQGGEKIERIVENEEFAQLVSKLRAQNLIIISIEEIKTGRKKAKRGKIKPEDLVIFSRQLSTLLDAGITLVQGLNILSEQVEKERFKEIIRDLEKEIRGGKSFSEALSKYPSIFSSLFVNMVRAGEKSGRLSATLDRLSTYLERTNALLRKVRSALIYPAVVSSMAIIITMVLLLKVIPTFKNIFSALGGTLPLPTQILINISDFTKRYFPIAILCLGGIVCFVIRYSHTEKGRFALDRLKLQLPIFGILFRKVAISKFCRTFSTLVESGVSILDCLSIVGRTAGNKVIEKTVIKVKESIREGENIASPLGNSGIFPPLVTRMIAVGEQSGQLSKMLSKIADFYEQEVDAAVSGLTSLIEPIIIAFLGIVIGSIAVAMLLPIFKISTLIR